MTKKKGAKAPAVDAGSDGVTPDEKFDKPVVDEADTPGKLPEAAQEEVKAVPSSSN